MGFDVKSRRGLVREYREKWGRRKKQAGACAAFEKKRRNSL